MKITVAVDEELLREAAEWTGSSDYSDLVRQSLVTLIQKEVSRHMWEQGYLADRRNARHSSPESRRLRR